MNYEDGIPSRVSLMDELAAKEAEQLRDMAEAAALAGMTLPKVPMAGTYVITPPAPYSWTTSIPELAMESLSACRVYSSRSTESILVEAGEYSHYMDTGDAYLPVKDLDADIWQEIGTVGSILAMVAQELKNAKK